VRDGRHTLAEERSLELHRLVAERLRKDPQLLDPARERARGWLRSGAVAARWAREWLEVLGRPLGEIVAVMIDPGERSRQLRQTSPFAGVLDPKTRWETWRSVGERFEGTR
jgi:hypothetical protein